MDIYAHGDGLVIRCGLAGVPREDVEVAICDEQIEIESAGSDELRVDVG